MRRNCGISEAHVTTADRRGSDDMRAGSRGPGAGSITVILDTSVLFFKVLDRMGLEHDAPFDVSEVCRFVKGRRVAIFGDLFKELKRTVKHDLRQSYDRRRTDCLLEDMRHILRDEGVRQISNKKCSGYRAYRQEISEMVDWMASHPCHDRSIKWVMSKRTSLIQKEILGNGKKNCTLSKTAIKAALEHLKREICKKDMKVLAVAMKIAETDNVCFVSNDGDHLLFREWAGKRSQNRLSMWRPSPIAKSRYV